MTIKCEGRPAPAETMWGIKRRIQMELRQDPRKKIINDFSIMDLQVHGTNLLKYPGHLLEMPNKDK